MILFVRYNPLLLRLFGGATRLLVRSNPHSNVTCSISNSPDVCTSCWASSGLHVSWLAKNPPTSTSDAEGHHQLERLRPWLVTTEWRSQSRTRSHQSTLPYTWTEAETFVCKSAQSNRASLSAPRPWSALPPSGRRCCLEVSRNPSP
jgi:hypothetical protein